jgi:multidrug efflux pump subunit AcrB
MTAIPFGLTGAVLGHWIMGIEIGAMSMLAFFALTGIVVNDSIVLVSFFKEEVARGKPIHEALESAAIARFRAILLTSLTTIAGLLPLIYQPSTLAIYVVPIAVTLVFGLMLSTLLVLLVIPALMLLLEGIRARVGVLVARLPIHRPIEGVQP